MAKAKKRKKSRKKAKRKLSLVERLRAENRALVRRVQSLEKKRFIGPILPGKKRRKPSKTEQSAVRSTLRLFLEGIKRQLEAQDIGSKYRSHVNEDYSIDAELRVPIENSDDIEPILIDIEDSGAWNTLSKFWVMMGVNTSADDVTGSPTIDKRPHRAWTNPVRGNRSGAAFFVLRETVVRNLESAGATISMVVIRLYWHPDNNRPMRPRK